MKIQNINSVNFGLKKISNKKAYKKQIQSFNQSKAPSEINITKPYYPGKEYYFDKFDNRKTIIITPNGNTILSKEEGFNHTSIELIEQEKGKTKTTRFNVNKKTNEKSECSYKITENGKSKIMSLNWNFPGKNYDYKGSNKDLPRFKKALQHLRNTIHEKEYTDDFGFIREINFQFKAVIGYLQDEIENIKK